MSNPSTILQAHNVQKTYHLGSVAVPVLKGASLKVQQGEWVAILGASGSGKSTLLHLLGDLDSADTGEVVFESSDLKDLSESERDRYRNQSIGFVFQFYHLLPELNVLDNTMLPGMITATRRGWLVGFGAAMTGAALGMGLALVIRGALSAAGVEQLVSPLAMLTMGGMFGLITAMLSWPRILGAIWPGFYRQRDVAMSLLTSFGLGHRLKHRPRELSGGERQRVAIARALMNNPRILLADEPTGNLDEKTGNEILDLIAEQHKQGLTIVMVTHDPAIAKRADRVVQLHDGRVVQG